MYGREIERSIQKHLHAEKILLILWARQVGKTSIMKKIKLELEEQAYECFYINLEDPLYLGNLNGHPKNILDIIGAGWGKKYVFIDEIQLLDNPSNFLKYLYDEHREQIKLIVSGSSAFYIDTKFRDSLAGRKKIFYTYTLNFREFLLFKKQEKIYTALLQKHPLTLYTLQDILPLYHEYIIYGGYPELVLCDTIEEKKEYLQSIANSYIKKDILEASIRQHDKYYFILKILAAQTGNLVNMQEIWNTINLPNPTVERYIYTMQKSFHIGLVRPFYERNIRKELTKMPKVYFFDTGLRNYFAGNFEPLEQRVDIWALLENLVYKNLLTHYTFDSIKFWRTQNKNEVDFVLEDTKKAYEVKARLKNFDLKKYSLFQTTYPEYNLEAIDLEKSIELLLP